MSDNFVGNLLSSFYRTTGSGDTKHVDDIMRENNYDAIKVSHTLVYNVEDCDGKIGKVDREGRRHMKLLTGNVDVIHKIECNVPFSIEANEKNYLNSTPVMGYHFVNSPILSCCLHGKTRFYLVVGPNIPVENFYFNITGLVLKDCHRDALASHTETFRYGEFTYNAPQ